jgi:hypothetical protein
VHDDTTPFAACLKVAAAWIGYLFGSITLQNLALAATLVYTVVQLYILIRDKIVRRTP